MKYILLFVFTLFFIVESDAQVSESKTLFSDQISIEPENEGALSLSIDNISFFKDNEYDGDIVKGYSLPGFRFHPRIIYQPTSFAKLEAGLSLLRFWGSNQYPCYSYLNIPEWNADSYQQGFHLLPFFRAQIQPVKQLNVVIGSIYGGGNHGLYETMYNPELDLIADPETGIQALFNSRIAKIDCWVNWNSFIFKGDTRNETFTVGVSSCLNITRPESTFSLSIPLQGLVIHHGGEIDSMMGNLSTQLNAMTGLRFRYNANQAFFKGIQLDLVGASYRATKHDSDQLNPVTNEQNDLLPFYRGWAFYPRLQVDVHYLKFKAAFWRSSQYINLLGNPIYGNYSSTIDGRIFSKTDVFNTGLIYEQGFEKGIHLGADVDFFYNPRLLAFSANHEGFSKSSKSFNFSFGIYLRINPSIYFSKKRSKKTKQITNKIVSIVSCKLTEFHR